MLVGIRVYVTARTRFCRARLRTSWRRAEADNPQSKEQRVMESVGRMFLCARCRERTVLCSRCDRGQIYCGQSCSRAARVEAQQAAGQRYQSTGIGRVNHVERTRRWRLRQKERRAPGAQDAGSVTHQGSQQAPTAEPVLPSSLLARVEPSAATEAAQTHWFCPECAAALHPWVRLGFVNRRRARASLRSARARPQKARQRQASSLRSLPSKSQNRVLTGE